VLAPPLLAPHCISFRVQGLGFRLHLAEEARHGGCPLTTDRFRIGPGLISHQLLPQLFLLRGTFLLTGIKKLAQKLVALLLGKVAVYRLGMYKDAAQKPLLGGAGGTREEPGFGFGV